MNGISFGVFTLNITSDLFNEIIIEFLMKNLYPGYRLNVLLFVCYRNIDFCLEKIINMENSQSLNILISKIKVI